MLQLAAANSRIEGLIGHGRSDPGLKGTYKPTSLLLELQELKGKGNCRKREQEKIGRGMRVEDAKVQNGRKERIIIEI